MPVHSTTARDNAYLFVIGFFSYQNSSVLPETAIETSPQPSLYPGPTILTPHCIAPPYIPHNLTVPPSEPQALALNCDNASPRVDVASTTKTLNLSAQALCFHSDHVHVRTRSREDGQTRRRCGRRTGSSYTVYLRNELPAPSIPSLLSLLSRRTSKRLPRRITPSPPRHRDWHPTLDHNPNLTPTVYRSHHSGSIIGIIHHRLRLRLRHPYAYTYALLELLRPFHFCDL